MNKPSITQGIGFISFYWPDLNLRVYAEQYTPKLDAYLAFRIGDKQVYENLEKLGELMKVNFLIKRLEQESTGIPWKDVLESIKANIREIVMRGEPLIPIGKKPASSEVSYQLSPILEKNQPTTLYSPGGFGKSYLAAYIACLVQFNIIGITDYKSSWMPEAGNVLYLDWEACPEDHERRVWAIKQGLEIDTEETFLYRVCYQPLVNDINTIQRLVAENDINLLIIDSQMAAAGSGPDASQVAQQYYDAIRSLHCTTLTLDHVSKTEWSKGSDSDSTGPYGSVAKFNRSRSQFEIKKSQTPGDDCLELALVHRKHNEGKLLKPIGIRIDFQNAGDVLEKVTFSSCNLADSPELSKTQTLRDRITRELQRCPMTVQALAEALEKPEGTIRMELNRKTNKGVYAKRGNEWALLALGYD